MRGPAAGGSETGAMFARNVALETLGTLGATGLALVMLIVMARVLSPRDFGAYGFAVSYAALWEVLMNGGAAALLTREVAGRKRRGMVQALLVLTPAKLTLGFAGLLVVGQLLAFERSLLLTVGIVGAGAAFSAAFRLALGFFRGHQELRYEATHLLAQRALFALLGIAALALGAGVLGMAGAFAASSAAVTISAFWIVGRRYGPVGPLEFAPGRDYLPEILRASGLLLVADLFSQLHVRGDQIVLKFTRDLREVGLYAAPRRLIDGFHLVPSAFAVALFPRLVGAWQEAPARFAEETRRGLRFVATLAAEFVLVGVVWGDDLLGWALGPSYEPSRGVFRVLLAALCAMMLNVVLTQGLIAVGDEGRYAVGVALAALGNLALNLTLTPSFGAVASAYAALGSELLLGVLCLLGLRRFVHGLLPLRQWACLGISSMALCAGLLFARAYQPALAGLLTVGIAILLFEVGSPIRLRNLLAFGVQTTPESRLPPPPVEL